MAQTCLAALTKAAFLLAAPVVLGGTVQEADSEPSSSAPKLAPEVAALDLPTAPLATQEFIVDDSERMTVPVRINGSDPYPFIVDTGAERTVIANDLGQLLSLSDGPELRLVTVSGPTTVNSYRVGELSMSAVNIRNLEAPALKRRNLGAYGLLGIDSLEKHKVRIDFTKNLMDVLPSKKKRNIRRVDRNTIIVNARRRAGRLVLTDATIGGMRVDIVIDTGAQSSMGNRALRKRLGRSQRRLDYVQVGLTSVTGERIVGDFTQIKEIVMGGLTITDLPVTFTEQHAFRALDLTRRPAMLLGMDAMKLFDNVEIDFANKRVVFQLKKRSRLQSPLRLALKDPSAL